MYVPPANVLIPLTGDCADNATIEVRPGVGYKATTPLEP